MTNPLLGVHQSKRSRASLAGLSGWSPTEDKTLTVHVVEHSWYLVIDQKHEFLGGCSYVLKNKARTKRTSKSSTDVTCVTDKYSWCLSYLIEQSPECEVSITIGC